MTALLASPSGISGTKCWQRVLALRQWTAIRLPDPQSFPSTNDSGGTPVTFSAEGISRRRGPGTEGDPLLPTSDPELSDMKRFRSNPQ
jgi:hypothetical protein